MGLRDAFHSIGLTIRGLISGFYFIVVEIRHKPLYEDPLLEQVEQLAVAAQGVLDILRTRDCSPIELSQAELLKITANNLSNDLFRDAVENSSGVKMS